MKSTALLFAIYKCQHNPDLHNGKRQHSRLADGTNEIDYHINNPVLKGWGNKIVPI